MPTLTIDDVMTAAQVAELLQVSESTVRWWASRNELPSHKLGRRRRYIRSEIEEWVMGPEPKER